MPLTIVDMALPSGSPPAARGEAALGYNGSMKTTRQLTAIIEREGDAYVALCPELDLASQGDTVEAARVNLIEAPARKPGRPRCTPARRRARWGPRRARNVAPRE